ncbi:MAG: hypothetical protein SOI39_05395 [Bifidobacterium mongoliense]|jgi:hypothetical protein|uniref:hypothetical protein n=2 Tax=Bifidobacterium mongoliense TaxID=518643 RepID=UPI002F35921A
MTSGMIGTVTEHLRQGDVLEVPIDEAGEEVGLAAGPVHVAILSQTCDVVQSSKPFILVAPAKAVPERDYHEADKGKKPLLIPLFDCWVADAGKAFSISKTRLSESTLVRHSAPSDQGTESTQIRASVARAFGRFPFPDDIPSVFNKLITRLQKATGREGNLSKVIDSIHPIRVRAADWGAESIRIIVYVIIDADEFIPNEEVDVNWSWERLEKKFGSKIVPSTLSLDDVCCLISKIHEDDRMSWDLTSLFHLWNYFGKLLSPKFINSDSCPRVQDIDVQVLSDKEFTYADYLRSEALDVEALSRSGLDPR